MKNFTPWFAYPEDSLVALYRPFDPLEAVEEYIKEYIEEEGEEPDESWIGEQMQQLEWDYQDEYPSDEEILYEDKRLIRRQRKFQEAAEVTADVLSACDVVQRVVAYGVFAAPLTRETPRFRRFRKHGVRLYKECHAMDLGVWLTSTDNLSALRKAAARVSNMKKQDGFKIGLAPHQKFLSIMSARDDEFLGTLCMFAQCPKGKIECHTPGCGEPPFLMKIDDIREWVKHPMQGVHRLLFDRRG